MIHAERLHKLNRADVRPGRYVLYWMQASQRAHWNHALEYAIERANILGVPALACFGITDAYPEANARHYTFMVEGLAETQAQLEARGVKLVTRLGSPEVVATSLAGEACEIVADKGYLRQQKQWRRHVARHAPCRVTEVEADAVVPVETTSIKEEYAAATIRPKIHSHLDRFMARLKPRTLKHDSLDLRIKGLDLSDPSGVLRKLDIDHGVSCVTPFFLGGTSEAERRLRHFIRTKLNDYGTKRSDPSLDIQSHMSPYLHFGQISPLYVALKVRDARSRDADARDAYLEELIVRRELSLNFVYFNRSYDTWDALPNWVRGTLRIHQSDARETAYSLTKLEAAVTHDPYWNAAQMEMVLGGKMHNYMRMYWGKKILEWTRSPRRAFNVAVHLNNKYELDGRDPNSYAGVAWCFGKHDRPWTERAVFGKVRYMNSRGLERKFDIAAYVDNVKALRDHCRE